jgi:hypothetical protein
MKKALSVDNILKAKFNVMSFDGKWYDAFGNPERTGCMTIHGPSKNGKTDFVMQLSKYLTHFGRVLYCSIEEGLSKTIQVAIERNNMKEVGGKFTFIGKITFEELKERLKSHCSPNFVVIDSIQFMELKFSEYKELKAEFKNKLFIYISHEKNKLPDGSAAIKIYRDSNATCRVEGFRAFPTSRYGGGEYINISDKYAQEYWGIN